MRGDKFDVLRGGGNVFRDLGHTDADVEHLKTVLAAEIIKTLNRQRLNVRAAHNRTGVAAADFSRIRIADLGRFTVDRLISIINRLGLRVEMRIRLHPADPAACVKNLDRSRHRRARKINDYDASNTATLVGTKPLKFANLGLKLPEV
jgi:predicted XRE-type DNA-binding protein